MVETAVEDQEEWPVRTAAALWLDGPGVERPACEEPQNQIDVSSKLATRRNVPNQANGFLIDMTIVELTSGSEREISQPQGGECLHGSRGWPSGAFHSRSLHDPRW